VVRAALLLFYLLHSLILLPFALFAFDRFVTSLFGALVPCTLVIRCSTFVPCCYVVTIHVVVRYIVRCCCCYERCSLLLPVWYDYILRCCDFVVCSFCWYVCCCPDVIRDLLFVDYVIALLLLLPICYVGGIIRYTLRCRWVPSTTFVTDLLFMRQLRLPALFILIIVWVPARICLCSLHSRLFDLRFLSVCVCIIIVCLLYYYYSIPSVTQR
jgi:hypothetical protein